jgi:hypothetical protein
MSYLSHVDCKLHPSHPPLLNHHNYIWQKYTLWSSLSGNDLKYIHIIYKAYRYICTVFLVEIFYQSPQKYGPKTTRLSSLMCWNVIETEEHKRN